MENRWLRNLNALPGPLWLFGGYAVSRLGMWGCNETVLLVNCSSFWSFDWPGIWMFAQIFVSSLLPLLLFGLLVARKPYALSLMGWYAVGKSLACIVGLISPMITCPVPELLTPGELTGNLLRLFGWCGVWVALMVYIERSKTLAVQFPAENRRNLWWAAVLIVLLCLSGG